MKWRSLPHVITVITIVLVQSLIWAAPLQASTLTSASLTLSDQHASTASNQTLEFVTPTGVDASSDTIVLEYESGFSLTSLSSPGDFDLAVDDDAACDGPFSDKTLAASAAAGTWGVGVSGQVITFTAPTDAASGEITASRCVQIQIGTNASGGSNKIVNPGLAGSYEVDIYGTFGDHAMYAVGVQSNATITNNATVNIVASGGGTGPPGPVGDTTPPTISGIVVSNITTNSATISWVTDEAAESELFYGLDTSYTEPSQADPLYRTVHTRNITGLLEGVEYHFLIWTSDNSGNTSTSGDITFSTLDATPPTITNLQVIGITETTATVTWETNEVADSTVSGPFGIFTDFNMVLTHSITLTGLTPATSYLADAFSSDPSGNLALQVANFTTLIDLPPTNVTGFTAVPGDGQVGLSWVNPTDPDFANVVVRFQLGSFPTSITSGTQIYSGTGTSFIHSGLINGTEYFYTIFVVDTGGNVSSGSSVSMTPTSSALIIGLSMTNLQVISITQTSAVVTWVTSGPADSSVIIPLVGTFSNAPFVSNHSVAVTGLIANTPYALIASSTDGAPVTASASISFTTLSSAPTPPTPPEEGDDDEGDEEDEDGEEDDEDEDEDEDEEDEEVIPPEPDVLISRTEVQFLVARDAIALIPMSGNVLRVLGNRPLAVNLDLFSAPADVTSVQLRIGSALYLMNPETSIVVGGSGDLVTVGDDQMYSARIITPRTSGQLEIIINYITGEVQVIDYTLSVQSEGIVADIDSGAPISGATVSTFLSDGGIWNSIPFSQINPLTSGEGGEYAWYVPNGTYRFEVQKSGYNVLNTVDIAIGDNIVNAPIELVVLLPPLFEEIKSIADIIPAIAKRLVNSVKVIRQNPAVQETASIAAPVVAVTAVSTVALLATSFNAIRFLQYMFTAPFMLFRRRRRKKWGTVYDSLRKVPVGLAIVRLIDVATNRIVKSQVTDRVGRFLFVVDSGLYRIEVRKEGFDSPTEHLKDQKIDGDYLDLYHGENIEVNEQSAAIAVNIPVDPVGQEIEVSKKILIANWSRHFMYGLSVVGLIVAIGVAIVDPSAWTIGLAVGQAVVLALFIKLAMPSKPTSWGIVYDEKTRRPLSKAIVRIFDPKYNKLLETQITDSRGRYAFLVGPNEYYTTYEKKGFQKVEVRPIDRTDTKEASYVSMDIPLSKHNNQHKNS